MHDYNSIHAKCLEVTKSQDFVLSNQKFENNRGIHRFDTTRVWVRWPSFRFNVLHRCVFWFHRKGIEFQVKDTGTCDFYSAKRKLSRGRQWVTGKTQHGILTWWKWKTVNNVLSIVKFGMSQQGECEWNSGAGCYEPCVTGKIAAAWDCWFDTTCSDWFQRSEKLIF